VTATNTCPACGGVQIASGQIYVGDGVVCHCQRTSYGGTVMINPWKPVPTQLDRIEEKLDELLRMVRNAKN
jgi:hypothetical protein